MALSVLEKLLLSSSLILNSVAAIALVILVVWLVRGGLRR